MDVTTALLYGYLLDEVYMKQPEGFVAAGKEKLVCRLKKGLYGLRQSPRVWNSTQEAEYMAAYEAAREAIWLRTLLQELGYPSMAPTAIYADNNACIALAKGTAVSAAAKAIDIKYHYVREKSAVGLISLVYVPTRSNLADMFTKPLPRASFENFRSGLGVVEVCGPGPRVGV